MEIGFDLQKFMQRVMLALYHVLEPHYGRRIYGRFSTHYIRSLFSRKYTPTYYLYEWTRVTYCGIPFLYPKKIVAVAASPFAIRKNTTLMGVRLSESIPHDLRIRIFDVLCIFKDEIGATAIDWRVLPGEVRPISPY